MMHVFIDGAAGTTGLEIATRLAGRNGLTMIVLDDDERKNAGKRADALNSADIAILCLPDEAARDAVALVRNPATRIIDASTAHRTAPEWTYGFPEMGYDVARAHRVSNPGCYATGFIALVAPLVRAGIIGPDTCIACNAVSGYSGGGKSMIADYENGPAPAAWRTYALVLSHKHLPEMQHHAGLSRPPIFAPSVANTYRGMLVDVPLHDSDAMAIRDTYAGFYERSPLVWLIDHGDAHLTVDHMAGRDGMNIFVFASSDGRMVRLVAALDNLGKGASGACVQSLNLMAGFPETEGLNL